MKHIRGFAALTMIAPVLLMVGVGAATTADAATPMTLFAQSGRSSCPGGATPARGTHGSATVSDAPQPSEGLTVEVSLQGALLNHTYIVHLIECNGSKDLGPSTVGTFQTDGNGDGTFVSDHVERGAADHAFVGIIDDPPTSIFATRAVQI